MPRVRELTIQYRPHASGARIDGRKMTSPGAAAAVLTPILETRPDEVFVLLLLDTKRRLIAVHEISKGALDQTLVDPRVVFRACLLANAAAVILAHNHPSGDPTPSLDDLNLTARIAQAGELMAIEVHDHIIIGDERYHSMHEHGQIVR